MMPGVGMGSRIDKGKYEIVAPIGRGGMSYVWLGRDRRLDKLWAIKEYRPTQAQGAQARASRQAILDEADFIKRLDHAAIPRVVDIVDDRGSVFVVMDFVDGTSLDKMLRQEGAFDQERVISWGIQLCDVLHYLHTLPTPVVYRDMKPANVMLRGDDTVRLVDFGIAMELLPSGPTDTRVIGTAGYGAPEQVNGEAHRSVPVDTRADIYALGATLYSLVTGHVPRRTVDAQGRSVVEFALRPIREEHPQLSEGLERILVRATRRRPQDRYQSVSEMRYDLVHYRELTEEYRALLRAKVRGFQRRSLAAGTALALGLGCLLGSLHVRSSSYEALVGAAESADQREREAGSPSEAEALCLRAVEVDPARIDAYQRLVALYSNAALANEGLFSTTESRRWMGVWQSGSSRIEGDPAYGKLCYDAGIMYLVFYDYLDTRARSGAGGEGDARGQGAIENSVQSVWWFREALAHGDSLSASERANAQNYLVVGEFYAHVARSLKVGDQALDQYRSLSETLRAMLLDRGSAVGGAEPIVRLRTFQMGFEAIDSGTYLGGMRRAGLTRTEAERMLEATKAGADAERESVQDIPVAQGIYRTIEDGYSHARTTIARVYGNPMYRPAADGQGDGEAN